MNTYHEILSDRLHSRMELAKDGTGEYVKTEDALALISSLKNEITLREIQDKTFELSMLIIKESTGKVSMSECHETAKHLVELIYGKPIA